MTYKVKDLIKLAEELGYVLDRTKGGHRQYLKNGKVVTISGKLSKDVPRGTANSIIKSLRE